MRTSISRKNTLRSSVLFLSMSAFILSVLVFTSCSDSESSEIAIDDTALITQIESAAKISVATNALPTATQSVLNSDLADSFVQSAALAEGLGYQLTLVSDDESLEEETSDAFFAENGRALQDRREKAKKRRKQCFQYVFPIDFVMADDSSITLESKEDWVLIKQWREANPDATERPELVFPIDVTLEDGTVQTLIDSDELNTVKDSCKKGKDKRKCFKLVLPVSFTMPDATIIEVNERADYKLMRAWKKANPEATERGVLNFPVTIAYKDETTAIITSEEEMESAKEACKN